MAGQFRASLSVTLAFVVSVLSLTLPQSVDAASEPVVIPMPFRGTLGLNGTNPPNHRIDVAGANWSTDIYAPANTVLSLTGLDPSATVTVQTAKKGTCGQQVILSISVDGAVGRLFYNHLVLDQDIRAKMELTPPTRSFGRLATLQEARAWQGYKGGVASRGSCYQVRSADGIHTHFEALGQDRKNRSCFADPGREPVDAGIPIGELGPTGVIDNNQSCPIRDSCPNLEGLQTTVPTDRIKNVAGDCVFAPLHLRSWSGSIVSNLDQTAARWTLEFVIEGGDVVYSFEQYQQGAQAGAFNFMCFDPANPATILGGGGAVIPRANDLISTVGTVRTYRVVLELAGRWYGSCRSTSIRIATQDGQSESYDSEAELEAAGQQHVYEIRQSDGSGGGGW